MESGLVVLDRDEKCYDTSTVIKNRGPISVKRMAFFLKVDRDLELCVSLPLAQEVDVYSTDPVEPGKFRLLSHKIDSELGKRLSEGERSVDCVKEKVNPGLMMEGFHLRATHYNQGSPLWIWVPGDSFEYRAVLVGIYSRGEEDNCGPGSRPNIYTKVLNHERWIEVKGLCEHN